MKKENNISVDISLVTSVILLIGIGFGFLYSSSKPWGIKYYQSEYYFLIRQFIYLIIGIAFFFIGIIIDYEIYKKYIKFLVILSIILLILPLIPYIGKESGGARRWINLRFFQFQPSEFAKLVVIFYLSSVLSNKKELIKDFYRGVLPPLIMVGFIIGLIFIEPHFSTSFLLIILTILMFYLAGIKIITFFMILITGLLGSIIMIFFAQYRVKRLFAFLNPWDDPLGSGWHYIQTMKCFALGKLFGVGIGESSQKYFNLPEAHNDYIFAVIAEEGGAFLTIVIIILYTLFVIMGFNIAKKCEDKYSYLLACGISSLIFIQAIINIGVVISVLPSTGMTLPFISFGGTSLIIFLFSIGILLNISKNNKREYSL